MHCICNACWFVPACIGIVVGGAATLALLIANSQRHWLHVAAGAVGGALCCHHPLHLQCIWVSAAVTIQLRILAIMFIVRSLPLHYITILYIIAWCLTPVSFAFTKHTLCLCGSLQACSAAADAAGEPPHARRLCGVPDSQAGGAAGAVHLWARGLRGAGRCAWQSLFLGELLDCLQSLAMQPAVMRS